MSISADVLTSYKKIDEAAADALLAKEIAANNKKIVVLDDDPTGVQTVHDIHVYTNWDHDSIKAGFEEENNLFYVMTNLKRPAESTFSSAAATPLCADTIRWRQSS